MCACWYIIAQPLVVQPCRFIYLTLSSQSYFSLDNPYHRVLSCTCSLEERVLAIVVDRCCIILAEHLNWFGCQVVQQHKRGKQGHDTSKPTQTADLACAG